jgi:hypothetical protein
MQAARLFRVQAGDNQERGAAEALCNAFGSVQSSPQLERSSHCSHSPMGLRGSIKSVLMPTGQPASHHPGDELRPIAHRELRERTREGQLAPAVPTNRRHRGRHLLYRCGRLPVRFERRIYFFISHYRSVNRGHLR